MSNNNEQQLLVDTKYNFVSMFNRRSGAYVRTGVLDSQGRDTGVEPFMASFPHLIDVGIMGHCKHGKTGLCLKAGVGCYQSGYSIEQPNMSVEDFRSIAKQSSGKVNQFALGGRGDPDQHEYFEEILSVCREYDIVPNYTTSGYGYSPALAEISKRYCGAVAVSWYRTRYTLNAIEMLLEAKVKTNVHYILSKRTIEEAVRRIESNDFPLGINAVIFLLHKPVGAGKDADVLQIENPYVGRLFELVDQGQRRFKLGFDSCSIPGVVNFCTKVIKESIEPCEGARFSCYISSDMKMVPCSFDQELNFSVSLREMTMEEAWMSPQFERFRAYLRMNCSQCPDKEYCLGGCPLKPEIVLCNRKEN